MRGTQAGRGSLVRGAGAVTRGWRRGGAATAALIGLTVSAGAARAQTPVGGPATGGAAASTAGPTLTVWAGSSQRGLIGTPSASQVLVHVDRPAHVAVLGVDRAGVVRVLSPTRPSEGALVQPGEAVQVAAFPVTGIPPLPDAPRVRLPMVVVLAADGPLDLRVFGTGEAWDHQLQLTNDVGGPEAVTAALRDHFGATASQFSLLAPALPPALLRVGTCLVQAPDGAHDEAYFRDLWATFDPWDTRLGPSPATLVAAGGAAFGAQGPNGLVLDGQTLRRRAQVATNVWRQSPECTGTGPSILGGERIATVNITNNPGKPDPMRPRTIAEQEVMHTFQPMREPPVRVPARNETPEETRSRTGNPVP